MGHRAFGDLKREQATAKANAGVLRFAQNDRVLVAEVEREGATTKARVGREMVSFPPFAVMPAQDGAHRAFGDLKREQATAKQMRGSSSFAQNDRVLVAEVEREGHRQRQELAGRWFTSPPFAVMPAQDGHTVLLGI